MNDPTHIIQFTLSNGVLSLYCDNLEEALKVKKGVLDQRNNVAKKGDLYSYQKDESDLSLFVSTVQAILITSIKDNYDIYYFRVFNEKTIEAQIDEHLFVEKYKQDTKFNPAVEQAENVINNASLVLKRIEVLNYACDSFVNVVNTLNNLIASEDVKMDPGLLAQFQTELANINKRLDTVIKFGENNV